MRTRRGILIAITLVLLTAGSVAAAAVILLGRMPDPDTCNRHNLGRWLVSVDVSNQSSQMQQRLAKRLLHELDEGVEISKVKSQLTARQSQMFWQNVDYLCQQWFAQCAQQYQAAGPTQRVEQVDQLIERVEAWGIVGQLAATSTAEKPSTEANSGSQSSKSSNGTLSRAAVLNEFRQKIELWIAAAPAERQPAMREFLSAIEGRLLFRSFKNMRLFG